MARYGIVSAWLVTARFAFSLQFSTAIEWVGFSTCHHRKRTTKKTHNKGAYRRNGVLHSRHVDVFNSNGEVYENAWDLPPAAETVVAVTRVVEEEGRDVRAGVLCYFE